jgi:ribosomal protein L15
MRGGFGQAGRYRGKKSRLIRTGEFANMRYEGKKGFNPISRQKRTGGTLNLWQLSELADRLVSEKKAKLEGTKVIIDLELLGFRKLLGSGSISRAVQVRNGQFSQSALKKIKDAGGGITVQNPPKAENPSKVENPSK